MSSTIFYSDKFRDEVALFAARSSYRDLEKRTAQRISYSKLHKIGSGKTGLKIVDVEIIMEAMGTSYKDYLIEIPF